MKKSKQNFYKFFVQTIALLFLSAAVFAQNVVSGKVTDSKDGTPLAGVTIVVKGSRTGVQTGPDGTFKINAQPNAILVFSSVGFTGKEVAVAGKTFLDISLAQGNQQLNEVVVIGYGTARKKDLTGAVSTVSSKDFQKGAITTPEQLIAGKVPGVAVTSNGGQPGSGSQIRIRGGNSINASNDPLIVVDGVLLDPGGINGAGNALSMINVNDIETFTVLKDASSTAIYGSRASGGVILITTKKGRTGELKVNFSTALSIAKLIKEVDVYTGDEMRAIISGLPASMTGKTKALAQLGTANTNWQDEIYHTAISTDNNISITGGIKKLPYRLSLGYGYYNGILQTDHLQKTSVALNLNPSFLKDNLKVNINIKGTSEHARFGNQDAIGGAVSFDPTQSVHSGNNRYGGYYQWLDASQANGLALNRPNNPVGQLMQTNDDQKPNRSIGNIQLDYKFPFLPALRANVNVGYDVAKSTGNKYISDSAATNYSTSSPFNPSKGGTNERGKQTKESHFVDFYLNYVKDLKSIKSRVDVTAGYSYNYYEAKKYNFQGHYANGDTIPNSIPQYEFSKDDNATIGVFGRAVYTYNDKYVVTATIRRDGSSRFAKANRWETFPSVAFAWRIKDEPFLKNNTTFSDLKFRAGYGKTGQQEGIANYTYFYGFNQANAQSAYQMGKDYIQGQAPTAYNPNLKWEITDGYNAAIDYGFLHNRITGSVDFYLKKTNRLLFDAAQPAGTNFSAVVKANIGKMENKGVEFNINAGIIRTKELQWDVNFNVSYNHNKITQLTALGGNYTAPPYEIPASGTTGILIYATGKPLGSFNLYHQIYDSLGKPIEGLYEDLNRDGIINEKDKYIGKTGIPNLFFGFSTNVTYKKWNAGFVLRANFNNYVYNNVASSKGNLSQTVGGYNTANLSTNYSETKFATNQYLSDYYLQNASFLKMDNLSVGYNAGKLYKSKANLRLSATVQNVFTITKYKGLDPEITNGIDNKIYPRPRTFTLGVNLDF